jgi:hypothetical protein
MWGVRRLAGFMKTRLPQDHGVLSQLPAFLAHANRCAELRLHRIGVLDRPLDQLSGARRAALVVEAYGGKALGALGSLVALPLRLVPGWPRRRRLTDTYLLDAGVTGFRLPAAGDAAQPQEP